MKKFLLSLTLLTAVLIGHGQIVLNEVYTIPDASKDHREFFELYNTSIDPNPIPLDCYSLVVYYFKPESGSGRTRIAADSGFYVLDFPNTAFINPKSYFVGSSANPFKIQRSNSTSSFTANLDYSNIDPATNGSLKRYKADKVNGQVVFTEVTPIGDIRNIFPTGAQQKDVFLAVFLFKSGEYVNGLMAKSSSVILPDFIKTMPNIQLPCSTAPLQWSSIASAEYVDIAAGSDNGFAREYDGICGEWDKTSNSVNHTPGTSNSGSKIPPVTGALQTSENIVCGNQVRFSITGPSANQNQLPVDVHLYFDNGTTLGKLDAKDEHKQTIKVESFSSTVYSFTTIIPANQPILIVYETALGCLDKVKTLTPATGSLTTTEKYICGSQVDFTVTGSTTLAPYAFPIEVEMYLDTDGDGNPDKDTVGATAGDGNLLADKTITSYASLRQTIEIPDGYKNQKVVIIYNSALGCLKLSKVPEEPEITLTTTPKNFCGNKVEFTVTGASADATTYAFPMKAQLFYDGDNDGEFDEAYGDPFDVTGIGPTVYSISIKPEDADKVFKVQYSSNNFQCITQQMQTIAGALSFKTAQFAVCTNSTTYTVNYNITEGAGDLASAYPFKAYLYADDADGEFDANDELLQTSADITSVGGDEKYFFNVPGDKSVFIIYRNATGCFEQVSRLLISPANSGCSVLPVTYQSFTAKRSNSSQVVLEWETATEAANKGFQIQRNIDGTWKEAGFVFSQANGGNSSTVLKYTFRDVNASKGISQYRILQVDATGKGQYSEIRAVRGDGTLARMMVFPNPSTTGSVSLLFEDGASVRDIIINDVSGRAIRQYKGISHSSLTIDQLQSGFYTVVVTNHATGITTTEKIIIKKR